MVHDVASLSTRHTGFKLLKREEIDVHYCVISTFRVPRNTLKRKGSNITNEAQDRKKKKKQKPLPVEGDASDAQSAPRARLDAARSAAA